MILATWLEGIVFSGLGVTLAYMGPGPGLAALGPLITLIGTMGLMLVGLIWYPVQQFLRAWRTRRAKKAAPDAIP